MKSLRGVFSFRSVFDVSSEACDQNAQILLFLGLSVFGIPSIDYIFVDNKYLFLSFFAYPFMNGLKIMLSSDYDEVIKILSHFKTQS